MSVEMINKGRLFMPSLEKFQFIFQGWRGKISKSKKGSKKLLTFFYNSLIKVESFVLLWSGKYTSGFEGIHDEKPHCY